MSNIFDDDKHLTQQAFQRIKADALSEIELLLITDHIAGCQECAEAFAECFNGTELAEAPSGFAEEVQSKIICQKVDNRQFYFYTMRVVIAATIALMITFSGAINYMTQVNSKAASIKPMDLTFVNNINTSLQNFSEKLLNMEVLHDEKEKR